MRSILMLAAVLTVSAAAGCGPSADAGPPTPVVTAEAVDLVARTGGYPAGQDSLAVAEDRLVARCMTAAGRRYVPSAPQTDKPAEQGYGLYAEHSSTALDPSANRLTNDHYLAQLSKAEQAAYLRALRGDDRDRAAMRLSDGREITYATAGCEAQARTKLFGDLATQVRVSYVPQIVRAAVAQQVERDPRRLAATEAWRRCMAAGGEPHDSSADARKQLVELYRTTGPTAQARKREIAVAGLDRSCTAQARLTETETELIRGAVAALPEPDQRELNNLAGSWRRAVETAATVS